MTALAPSLQGTLDDFSLDAVLSLLASSSQTGALHFSGPRPGSLWFAGGRIYRASTGEESDDERGLVVATLFELMVTGESFEFRQGETTDEADGSYDVAEVVADAAARVEQWRAIAATIPSTGAVLRLAARLPGRRAKFTLTAAEWEALALLDGRSTVADVMRSLGQNSFEVMATLHHFVDIGLVEVTGG